MRAPVYSPEPVEWQSPGYSRRRRASRLLFAVAAVAACAAGVVFVILSKGLHL